MKDMFNLRTTSPLLLLLLFIISIHVHHALAEHSTVEGDDWFVPSYATPFANSGLFSEDKDTSVNINLPVFDVAWRQINPTVGVIQLNNTATILGMDFATFINQNKTTQPFWMRIWTSGFDWAPSNIITICNVSSIGVDDDGQNHLPIWDPCVWGEIKKMYRYIFLEKEMRSDPRLKFIFIPGAFNWCEFDFTLIGNYINNVNTSFTFDQFNSWFQQAMQDLVNIFNGENTNPNDDYAYKLVYTGEDYPYDVDKWTNPNKDFFARDAVLKGMGIRTGLTEVFNDHLSEIPSYGTVIDQSNGHMVTNWSWPLLTNPNRVIACENECYTTCGYSVSPTNLYYAVKMSNLKALQMNVNWLYVVKTDSYLVQYASLYNWVRLSLGRKPSDAFDAWVSLRSAQDMFWVDRDDVTWPTRPWVQNYERFLVQLDKPGYTTTNGSTQYSGIVDPNNGKSYEGKITTTSMLFYLDDSFMFGAQSNVQIKVTYLNKASTQWKLNYNDGSNEVSTDTISQTAGSATNFTVTFNLTSVNFSNQLVENCDFRIVTVQGSPEILFVRVIKLSQSSSGSTTTASTTSTTTSPTTSTGLTTSATSTTTKGTAPDESDSPSEGSSLIERSSSSLILTIVLICIFYVL